MAVSFADRIHALSGFDANSTNDTDTGEDFDEMAASWMTAAAKDVIGLLPPALLERCGKVSSANANYTNGTGVEAENKVISVIRTRNIEGTPQFDNPGDVFVCRQIPHHMSFKSIDPDSLQYATETDPVWYYDHASGGDNSVLIKVLPTSTIAVAKVVAIDYPIFTAGDTETYDVVQKSIITNFPDEAENLVVIKASIYAAEYMAAIEEDVEVYIPIVSNLKKDFLDGVYTLQAGKIPLPKTKKAE